MSEIKNIPISKIKENPVALRNVNKQSESYMGLVDSIRQCGEVLNSISVKPMEDGTYCLIDGLHRFTAAQDAGLTEIPAQVFEMEEAEIHEAQIMANVHRIETRPVEYTKQLTKIMSINPTMTVAELAKKLAKSTTWVSERLGLLKLDEKIGELVDDGKINLTNAYALAKLPKEEQNDFVDRAMTLSPGEFVPTVNARTKEIRAARRAGNDESPAEFIPVAHLQKMTVIKQEIEDGKIGDGIIKRHKVKGEKDAFKMALSWVLHLDPDSVDAAKAKEEERKARLAEQRSKAKAEQKEKKAKAAAEKAAVLIEEAKKAKEVVESQ